MTGFVRETTTMASKHVSDPASPNLRGRADCAPGSKSGSGDLALPVVEIDPDTGMKRSRAGRWRALSLITVHLLILGHVLHWLWAGSTLTPVEPSEAMDTIRRGEINMGFLFFAAALIATLILGRWVCGWACHLVAYQDLTLWVLKKLHMRPKAFRSRFLVFIPLAAAAYMFLYPLAVRVWYSYQGRHVAPLRWHLSRSGFWDTFPGPVFAILTVLICGGAIIYFLGPKGFCTFACPYGAFFAITDKFATARIRVTDACRRCGHCSAVCTSNVNVAEEVRLYRMVVDPGCMKCLDCVETCPNDALYFGFGRPSLGAKPAEPRKARRYDMSLVAEFFALVIFTVFFVIVRGLYGSFPFLFSLGLAAVLTYLVMKGVALFHARDVLIQRLRLKIAGRIRPLGAAYGAGLLAVAGLTVHSGVWQYHNVLADRAFEQSPPKTMNWQYDPGFTQRITPEQAAQIASGIHHYEACRRRGLAVDVKNDFSLAWLYLFTRDREKASDLLREAAEEHPRRVDIWLALAEVETCLGHREQVRQALSNAVRFAPDSPHVYVALADDQIATGEIDAARATLIHASALEPDNRDVAGRLARLRMLPQAQSQAVEDYRAALVRNGDSVPILHNLAHALTGLRQYDEAAVHYRRAVNLAPDALDARAELGAVLFIQQDFGGAIGAYEYILGEAPTNAEAALRLAMIYYQVERREDAAKMLRLAERNGDETQRQNAKMLLNELSGPDVEDGRRVAPADPP